MSLKYEPASEPLHIATRRQTADGANSVCERHKEAPKPGDASTVAYRGTSLIRNHRPLEPYSRTMPRALWGC